MASADERRREGGSGHTRNKSLHATETLEVIVHNGGDGDGVIFIKHPQEEEYERGHWGSKAEFLLSCIGYSVGIGWLPKKIIIMITISFV